MSKKPKSAKLPIQVPGDQAKVYTIAAGLPFVDALAAGLIERTSDDAAGLARCTVLLPTRRAGRSLREAFLRQGGGRPLLLPRMLPLGDLDEDEILLAGFEDLPGDGASDIAPAISGLKRQLLLARLVLALEGAQATPDQAARLALELGRLLDQVHTERLSFDDLADLVPEQYARHWQVTLEFLKILTERWPAILADEGCVDPAMRRNFLLEARLRTWRAAPPHGPVIAAGSTGSIPATADLLDLVARLPGGAVVLPGFDTDLDSDELAALAPAHPQFGMARLLAHMGVGSADVRAWEAPHISAISPARSRLINDALRPATGAGRSRAGRSGAGIAKAALDGVHRIDCPGPDEEAQVIALMLRQALEESGRTAALVTPDRGLARRVAAELKRWAIDIDDSAGAPLARTPPGVFLRLTAEMAAADLAPVALLSACKHPLAAGGMDPPGFRGLIRRLEIEVLRGPRPGPGLAALRAVLAGDDKGARELSALLDAIEGAAGDFLSLFGAPRVSLSALVRAHVAFAEALAAADAEGGRERLWAGEAGEAAADFIAEAGAAADAIGKVRPQSYPALLDAMMAGRAVRPRYGSHPRLAILGLLEARLQHADLVILGGLNEGTWPPEATGDPWMSRPMRAAFGLPLPERRIGLTAHDFTQAFAAPNVALTRAKRVDGTPTRPARWLLRLENLLGGPEAAVPLMMADEWLHWQALIDRPHEFAALRPPAPAPPAPAPPVAARPRQLSVTQIETWMRDPYAVYARHILGLRALLPLDAAPDAADYGTFIHEALNVFLARHRHSLTALPEDAEAVLLEIGRQIFGPVIANPHVWAFWWPRFERICRWFVDTERRRDTVTAIATEVSGQLTFAAPAGPFTLTAKADRIDRLSDGTLAIIDYKTGTVPSKAEVEAGFAPQLPLEAAIASEGGFENLDGGLVSALDYWRLRGANPAGEINSAGDDIAALTAAARAGLANLVAEFDKPSTPYEARPRPDKAPRYSDYEHLARIKEWATAGEDGE